MQQMYYCPTCRSPVPYGAQFCQYCGNQLFWQQQAPPPPMYQQPQYYQQQQQGYHWQGQQLREPRGNKPVLIWFVAIMAIVLFVGGGIFAFDKFSKGTASPPPAPTPAASPSPTPASPPTPTPSDNTPPVITSISASTITQASAIITCVTNEPSTSQVDYGSTVSYDSTTNLVQTLVTSHSVTLSNLKPQTNYHYRVKVKDAAGNEAVSSDSTFTTASPSLSFSQLNTPLISQSGLTVTVTSITKNQKEGYKEYTISYLLKNNTPDKAIDEGTFKIFYIGGGGEPQYGFFDKLYPGDSKTRTYTWKVLNTQQASCVEFEGDFFNNTPSSSTLKWQVPQ